jgi:hypothetical protein
MGRHGGRFEDREPAPHTVPVTGEPRRPCRAVRRQGLAAIRSSPSARIHPLTIAARPLST